MDAFLTNRGGAGGGGSGSTLPPQIYNFESSPGNAEVSLRWENSFGPLPEGLALGDTVKVNLDGSLHDVVLYDKAYPGNGKENYFFMFKNVLPDSIPVYNSRVLYSESYANSYLNNEFYNKFSDEMKSLIVDSTININSDLSDLNQVTSMVSKIFLPCSSEVGNPQPGTEPSDGVPILGFQNTLMPDTTSRIGYLDGAPTNYWLRQYRLASGITEPNPYYINGTTGSMTYNIEGTVSQNIRPCFCLDPETFMIIDGEVRSIESNVDIYAGILFTRKIGDFPQNVNDGVKVDVNFNGGAPLTSYIDTGLVNGNEYYYRAFPYNSKKDYQTDITGAITSATPTEFRIPSYTGTFVVEGDATKGQIKLLTSGTLTLSEGAYDLFAVGGGGGGGLGFDSYGTPGGGGGSGRTATELGMPVDGGVFSVVIGAGGVGSADGSPTSVGNLISATGGNRPTASTSRGGAGGSGGGNLNVGGTNGGNGAGTNGGVGQGVTTRAFGESDNTQFAGGGGGGNRASTPSTATGFAGGATGGGRGGGGGNLNKNGVTGTANTGGGGGGAGGDSVSGRQSVGDPGSGGSGIIIIRWDRS